MLYDWKRATAIALYDAGVVICATERVHSFHSLQSDGPPGRFEQREGSNIEIDDIDVAYMDSGELRIKVTWLEGHTKTDKESCEFSYSGAYSIQWD